MAFKTGHAKTHVGTSLDLYFKALGMNDRSAICYPQVIENLVLPGFKIQLDLDKPHGQGRHRTIFFQIIFGHANEAGARQCSDRVGGHGVDVFWRDLAAVLATQFDGDSGGGGVADELRGIGFQKYPLIPNIVVFRRTTQFDGGNLQQFFQGIYGCHIVGPGHGERGIATKLTEVPGQMATAVAPLHHAVIPIAFQHLRRYSRGAGVRIGAEIADTGVNM